MNHRKPTRLDGRTRLSALQSLATLLASGIDSEQAAVMAGHDLPAESARKLTAGHGQAFLQRLESAGVVLAGERGIAEAFEQSGRLDRGLGLLAERLERRLQALAQVKARLALPLCILILALAIAPLPRLVTGDLGALGYLWRVASPLLLLAALVGLIAHFKETLTSMLARTNLLPGAGLAWRATLLRELGQLLDAGMDACSSLDLLAGAEAPHHQPTLRRVANQLRNGESVADSLLSSQLIDRHTDYPLLQTGEQAGRLSEMLDHRADQLQQQQRERTEMIAQWLPRLFYALVVAFIAYSLLAGSAGQVFKPATINQLGGALCTGPVGVRSACP